jgi:titin
MALLSHRLTRRVPPRRPAAPRPPCRPRLEWLECRLAPAAFAVSNTNDSGPGSLRQALLDANASPGLDAINFSVPGAGAHTISPLSPLPFVTDPAILDGATQPGYAGVPLIQLLGAQAGANNVNGLVVTAGGTLVRGLAVGGFSGIGVLLAANGGDVVAGNYVGTGVVSPGAASPANAFGVAVAGGGADQVVGNVISGNAYYGVTLNNTSGDVVANNFIGLNAAGSAAVANGAAGVTLDGTAAGNVVSGNVVGGNGVFGVLLYGPGVTGNVLAGNYVGLSPAGAALANGFAGVALGAGASGNTVGGPTPAYRNVISGNAVDGVYVSGAGTNNNVIESDYVGTDPAGNAAAPNGLAGVAIQNGAANNLVGADLISGNGRYGVLLSGPGTAGNVVASCLIGSNAAGNAALGNRQDGVRIEAGASGDLVSGDLLAANSDADVAITAGGAAGNVVQACLIGTNLGGTALLGTSFVGVEIDNGSGNSGNTIGGATRALGNVIGGCGQGVAIDSPGNAVLNNLVGTNAAGTALPNGFGVSLGLGSRVGNCTVAGNVISHNSLVGVSITGGGNTVGGTTAAARNVISGNVRAGVDIGGIDAGSNVIEGNYIGTAADGVTPLPNGGPGVVITVVAHDNTVGGAAAGAGNVIAFNGDAGVVVGGFAGDTDAGAEAGRGNAVLGNSIYGNAKLGIDLGPDDGVTANGSGTFGHPNNYQPFPVLTSAVAAGGAAFITGTLSIIDRFIAFGTYRVELFANAAADPSGHGDGQVFLGFVMVDVEQSSPAPFVAILAGPLARGQAVSATATDADGNTSEFSADVIVQ